MSADFKGKWAWVTGASGGIGEALALALAKRGSSLVLSARSETALQAVAEKCRWQGSPQVSIKLLDMTQPADIEAVASEVLTETGGIDLLFNNAGISQRALVKDAPMELYRHMMEINYFGTIALTKALLPAMIEKKAGHIVTISSLVGKIGSPLRSGYAASKHALHGFFDSLRAEVTGDNIQVLLVCPGFIKTDISKHALDAAGAPTGKMDDNQENGMPPSELAEKIMKAMDSGKQEIYVGGKEILALYIKRFFPGMINSIVRKNH